MATTRKEKMPSLKGKAFFRPETVDRDNMTVEIVFSTGEAGLRASYWSDPYEESLRIDDSSIRQERLKKGLSVLDSHNRYSGIGAVLGITEDYRIEKGQLVGTCRFSKNQQPVFEDVADGILRHVSLGYRIHEYKVTKAGKDNAIEQREAIDWEPLELSIVPVSFETTNGTREAERASAETYDVKLTLEETPMTEEEKAALRAQQEAETRAQAEAQAPMAPAVPTADEVRADTRKLLTPMLEAARAAGLNDSVATDAFAAGTGIDAFRAQVLEQMAATRKAGDVKSFATDPTLRSDGRRDEGETLIRSAEEAIMLRARVKGATLTDGAREFSGRSMMEIARTLLTAQGVNVRGLSPQKIATRAMHSTSDFPLILENVMNKNLLDAYRETPRTFLGLGQASTANDFRQKHLYRLGDAPSLKPLNEHGEYEAGTFGESKESYAIDTFARKIAFTRKMLINDDMGALDRMPRMFGPAGARLENDIVWGLLLNYDFINNKAGSVVMADNKALFHADHKNLLTTGSALSKAALTALRQLGRKMKTLDGQFMNVEYNAIAIPDGLETTAEDLLLPRIVAAKIEDQAPRQKMNIIVEPRLAVIDAAAWYAFSNMMDTFEYAHLAGEEEMYTEVNTNTDVDGLEVKVRKDFGAGLVDYRGMAKATGAA